MHEKDRVCAQVCVCVRERPLCVHECVCVYDRASEYVCVCVFELCVYVREHVYVYVCLCMHMHKGQALQPRIAWNSLYSSGSNSLLSSWLSFECGINRHEPLCPANFHSFVDVLSISTKCVTSVSLIKSEISSRCLHGSVTLLLYSQLRT